MKGIFLLVTAWLVGILSVFGAEKVIEPVITRATIFFQGAQVFSEATVTLTKGKTTIIFSGLSSSLDKSSVQVSAQGKFTILSVQPRINYLNKPASGNDPDALQLKIDAMKLQIETKNTEMKILNESKDFLISNITILGSDKAVDPVNFKLFSDYFSARFEDLEMKILAKQREINELNEKLKSLEQQAQAAMIHKDQPTAEVLVEVEANEETTCLFTLNYMIVNAGWYPTYDIRVSDIDHPVRLTYQANIYQNSSLNWRNVKLTFSNANPSDNANFPDLAPYYLNLNAISPDEPVASYDPTIRQVKGIVVDASNQEPIPFATIMIKDKSVGTTSDLNGNFSISIPVGSEFLQVNFIGYQPMQVPITNDYITIKLAQSVLALEEVMVVDYKSPLIKRKAKAEADKGTIPVEVNSKTYQTNFEFSVATPYNLESTSNPVRIDLMDVEVNSEYMYKSVPKISAKAFLMAQISDWEDYNLLDGEVNLYFENTYVGRSLLDISQISDTLEISLGPDKNITVKRELQKEYTSKQFLGNNKIESRNWKLTVKNNKSQDVKLILYDQVPVSNNEAITVNVTEISGGSLNSETGEVIWELDLVPGQSIEKLISYSVKYPKWSNVIIR